MYKTNLQAKRLFLPETATYSCWSATKNHQQSAYLEALPGLVPEAIRFRQTMGEFYHNDLYIYNVHKQAYTTWKLLCVYLQTSFVKWWNVLSLTGNFLVRNSWANCFFLQNATVIYKQLLNTFRMKDFVSRPRLRRLFGTICSMHLKLFRSNKIKNHISFKQPAINNFVQKGNDCDFFKVLILRFKVLFLLLKLRVLALRFHDNQTYNLCVNRTFRTIPVLPEELH